MKGGAVLRTSAAVSCSVFLFAFSASAYPHVNAPSSVLREIAVPLEDASDLDALLDASGESRLVLLGESTHGTAEFYAWRAEITRRLIREMDFDFVVVEGDWAPLFRLNRYVKDLPGSEDSALEVMRSFRRWPEWLWANPEVLELAEWMRAHNIERDPDDRVGFYGMDLYGESCAIDKVLDGLEDLDPDLAGTLEEAYRAYAAHGENYAAALAMGASSCETEVQRAVRLLERNRDVFDEVSAHERVAVLQSALVVYNAERHRRTGLFPGPDSWNYRVLHFWETCRMLLSFYGPGSKGIVWAHNTHIGDARATSMAASGYVNIGQLAREQLGPENVFSVGFGTHAGTVRAGASWGARGAEYTVPEGREGSVEDIMERTGLESALFIFARAEVLAPLLDPLPHRAIGVVYDPAAEDRNYVQTVLPDRYDAFIFISQTTALKPL